MHMKLQILTTGNLKWRKKMHFYPLIIILILPTIPRGYEENEQFQDINHCCGDKYEVHEHIHTGDAPGSGDPIVDILAGHARGGFTQNWSFPTLPSTAKGRIMNKVKLTSGSLIEERATEFRPVELRTRMGTIIGTAEFTEQPTSPPTTGRPFYAFRGIPYAAPPVGRLRFRDPQEIEVPWPGGRLDATQFRPFCPQYDHDTNQVVGQEDCLYLNIYTPAVPDQSRARLPVLVFLHGGSYLRGTASSLGPRKLMREDIVVVTANFRLGILGFLSTRDEYLPGNYGLLDQVEALRWVQRNIAQFGGDPNRVTLGGFDSGAAAVHLHMLSPRSKGLFNGAIMMSGAGNCVWSISEEPEDAAYVVGRHLDCSTWSTWYLRECLMDKTTDELIRAQAEKHIT
ncbi:Carboxylesterase [Halocaridina rubra]|uniref:Carboxylesterase n=1 Tax=Halocaridina rubra TaxID=373956 RepID=A0AAN8ZX09_HALRR